MGGNPEVKQIKFFDEEHAPLATITVTKPVSQCWTPTPNFLNARAIQAVNDGKIIAVASKINGTWVHNLVGGPSVLSPNGQNHMESVVAITRYFTDTLTTPVNQC